MKKGISIGKKGDLQVFEVETSEHKVLGVEIDGELQLVDLNIIHANDFRFHKKYNPERLNEFVNPN